jgi:protein TonB
MQEGGSRGSIISRGGGGTTVRVRTLFIATLSLSLAIHALILFALPYSYSKPANHNETYRVNLIQMPVQTALSKKPETIPVSAVNQEQTKPQEVPAEPRTEDTNKRELTDSVKQSEGKKTTNSQLQKDLEQATESQAEVPTTDSVRWTNRRSPMIPSDSVPSPRTDYQRILDELNKLLQEHLHYPETARRKGIEGTLSITFTLNTNGEATDVMVSESSGSHLLDRAAVRAISGVFPYSDPPDTPLHFTIPVTYRLTEPE